MFFIQEYLKINSNSFILCWSLTQVRTFRGHVNQKNFVGLAANSQYIACGSETNEVFLYHKVSNYFSAMFTFYHSIFLVKIISDFPRRHSRNQWLVINSVHLRLPMMRLMIKILDRASLVQCVGKVTAPLC